MTSNRGVYKLVQSPLPSLTNHDGGAVLALRSITVSETSTQRGRVFDEAVATAAWPLLLVRAKHHGHRSVLLSSTSGDSSTASI